jgi:eukaryotic-like serine/threonine-protein kinase
MTSPQRLGKYPITGILGKGAMGIVYRGYDPVIKRPVAIKTIRRELIDEDERAESLAGRFRKEAQAAGALNHPGIVSIYEYGEDANHAFIAMEYVEGNSLREYLARGARFEERDIVSIMSQLLDALDFAHKRTVWHRDVKPANIIIMGNGRIKLADFGIARIESSDRTLANVIMGTPGYIAPEHYLGQPTDHRIDIFSAGVLFYVLLSGQAPFRGRPEAIMHDVCYHDPTPPSESDNARRWAKYDPIVARAIAKAPVNRFETAGDFRTAILTEYARPVSESISESTIIRTPVRPAAGEGSSGVPASPGTQKSTPSALSTGGTTPPPGWETPVLALVEMELARYVGPVAKVLVRRAAREHKNMPALVAAVGVAIDASAERQAFAKALAGRGLQTGNTVLPSENTETSVGGGVLSGPAMSDQDLELATRLLTTLIGPIARVVTKRAAGPNVSRRDFFVRVAQSLETESQRERFLRDAGMAGRI